MGENETVAWGHLLFFDGQTDCCEKCDRDVLVWFSEKMVATKVENW